RQVGAREFSPAAAIEIRDRLIGVRRRGMGVATADHGAVSLAGVLDGAVGNLAGAAEEGLAAVLGQLGEAVRAVEDLEEAVGDVSHPGQEGEVLDETIEEMAMQEEDALGSAFEDILILDGDAEEVGNDLSGAVVVAGEPDDLDVIGEFAE